MNDIVERGKVATELDAIYSFSTTDNQQIAIVFTVLAIGASADLDLPPCKCSQEES